MAEIDEQDTTRATNDAYTGMLAISLIALIAGCALLYLDFSQYPSNKPPTVTAPAPQAAPAPGQAPQGNLPQGNPPGNVAPMPMAPMPMPMAPMNPPAKQ